MGKGIVNQITKYTNGMQVACIYNRHIKGAATAYAYAGITNYHQVGSVSDLEKRVNQGVPSITDDYQLLCAAGGIDIIVEVTGTVNFGANAVCQALNHEKHVLLYNLELDATLGPILKKRALQNGVMISGGDGDQPGAIMNLYRFLKNIGMIPLVCGNIKGLEDHYRTPTTQKSFAKRWGLRVKPVTSYADGSKISFEQAAVANATGMGVATRGMLGYHSDQHIDLLKNLYDHQKIKAMGGIVDYVVGAKPGPGVYVFAEAPEDERTRHYLDFYKMGKGPVYSFYTPYHLCYFEVPNSITRMIDFEDDVISPQSGPVVEVVAVAKKDIEAGEILDGIGGYTSYGQCENAEIARRENLLPIGISQGAVVKRSLNKDEAIAVDDVDWVENRMDISLFDEQTKHFFGYSPL
jgi:predicted homoserine dehydrogenase-like protein